MAWIEDITNLIRKGPELKSQLNSIKFNTKSVVKGANDATFQFPCLISDTVPIELANALVRTLERVYADYTQSWISMHQIFDMTLDPTPISYLKKLHQNIRLESVEESQDSGEKLDKYIQEAYNGENLLYLTPDKNYGMMISATDRPSKEMLESHKDYLTEYLSEYDIHLINEANSDETTAYDVANAILDSKIKQAENDKRITTMNQTSRGDAPKLLDREVKKSNDITPFGIQVRLIAKNQKNEFFQYIDIIIGVKAVMHPIKSDDMIINIQRSLQNKSVFFKLLRWTTGEISLFKNILLSLDDIKFDTSNNGSRWFPTLRRLKKKKVGVHDFTVPHAVIPNSTIAISSYEADYLEKNFAIDMRNPTIAKKLMDNLFLMTFVIIDEATGTISILYDGKNSFETYSLEGLEREISLNSNKLGREIGRMISH